MGADRLRRAIAGKRVKMVVVGRGSTVILLDDGWQYRV